MKKKDYLIIKGVKYSLDDRIIHDKKNEKSELEEITNYLPDSKKIFLSEKQKFEVGMHVVLTEMEYLLNQSVPTIYTFHKDITEIIMGDSNMLELTIEDIIEMIEENINIGNFSVGPLILKTLT